MLRVLLVEDSADDADLVHLELEAAGLLRELRRAWSEPTLRAALDGYAPDIAISDLNLPGYCGVAALRMLHQRLPRVPLVLLSGDTDQVPAGLPATVLDKGELARLPALVAKLARAR